MHENTAQTPFPNKIIVLNQPPHLQDQVRIGRTGEVEAGQDKVGHGLQGRRESHRFPRPRRSAQDQRLVGSQPCLQHLDVPYKQVNQIHAAENKSKKHTITHAGITNSSRGARKGMRMRYAYSNANHQEVICLREHEMTPPIHTKKEDVPC